MPAGFPRGDPVDSFATGDAYVRTGLADYNDYDNGFSLTKFDNNTTAYIQVGRTATCSHVESEIVGTKGTLRVNSVPRKNYLSQFTENGFVEECQESFLARWGEAFQAEIDDFVDCVRTGRKPETTAHDGTMSLKSRPAAASGISGRQEEVRIAVQFRRQEERTIGRSKVVRKFLFRNFLLQKSKKSDTCSSFFGICKAIAIEHALSRGRVKW